jgi:hypothetical protein
MEIWMYIPTPFQNLREKDQRKYLRRKKALASSTVAVKKSKPAAKKAAPAKKAAAKKTAAKKAPAKKSCQEGCC